MNNWINAFIANQVLYPVVQGKLWVSLYPIYPSYTLPATQWGSNSLSPGLLGYLAQCPRFPGIGAHTVLQTEMGALTSPPRPGSRITSLFLWRRVRSLASRNSTLPGPGVFNFHLNSALTNSAARLVSKVWFLLSLGFLTPPWLVRLCRLRAGGPAEVGEFIR